MSWALIVPVLARVRLRWPSSWGSSGTYLINPTRRLNGGGSSGLSSRPAPGVLARDPPSLTPEPSEFVKRASTFIPRSPKEVTRLRKRFMRAGYQTVTPLAVYGITQIAGVLVLGTLPLLWMRPPGALALAAAGAILGWLLPSFVLERLITKRQKVIRNVFRRAHS